jgi:hypothetical protein
MLRSEYMGCGLESTGLGYDQTEGFFEHSNGPLDSITQNVSNNQLLKNVWYEEILKDKNF